jgi:predicted ATP-binding protein involved in virulence
MCVLTRLLAKLRDGAFVLFDEPEINLHPSLLAAMLRVLHRWLERFNAYGVITTHSPIVLQEIPGRMVRVLSRQGRVPFVRRYESESFGQTLSEILVEVFGQDERDQNYASVLRDLVDAGLSTEEIEGALGRTLSINARMALRSLEQRRRAR